MKKRFSVTQPMVRGVVVPFFLVVAISILIIGGLVTLTQRGQERIAVADSIHLAHSVLKDIERRLADQLLDYSYWDQAVENLVTSFDADWADHNVGIYMHTRFRIASSYVLGADEELVYGMRAGQRSDENPLDRFGDGLVQIIKQARSSPRNQAPVPTTGLLWDGQYVHIVSASVLTDFQATPEARAEIATNSVLVFTRALDAQMLGQISQDYKLTDLTVTRGSGAESDAAFPLMAADGKVIGTLSWRVASPTKETMAWLLPTVSVVFLIFGAIGYIFFKRMQDTAAVLVKSKEETEAALKKTEQAKEQLVRLATIDHVTGLPNRALLFDRVEQAIEHARREGRNVGLVFVDLDQFKHINDTHGHASGDQLLKQVGERLGMLVRQGDTVARLGGDEFIVLLHDVELPGGPEIVAMKAIEAFSAPFRLSGRDVYVTASLGISIFPDDGEETEILIQHADAAMYQSKRGGRNTFNVFSPGLKDRTEQNGRIAERFRHAVDREEIELHFQPVIDLNEDSLIAVEALIRWGDEALDAVDPEELMAVAEDTGFILPIEKWVLAEACQQLAVWRRNLSPNLQLNVNVSGSLFRDAGFVTTIKEVLDINELPAEALTIEITENFLIGETDTISQQISGLAGLGVKVALDDFGTGYSSLRYLKKFNVSTLKIDRHFIRNIVTDKGDLALVEAIISMAHNLKLDVVAEGVETSEQLELICGLGCNLIQGFHFSAPLSVDQMTEYLSSRQEPCNCI